MAAAGNKRKNETLQFKSPAEFFAENQNIAGFDNAGKALYTTIREFVENSLDAAESAGRLPTIDLSVEEMDAKTFNRLRSSMHGINTAGGDGDDDDGALPTAKRKKKGGKDDDDDDASDAEDGEDGAKGEEGAAGAGPAAGKGKKGAAAAAAAAAAKKAQELSYFRITCRDNGCGMPHERIPDFLGRVLAGSKYGVRQTRGKFGLGAKMALIWSKKSTGLPIEVKTAHGAPARGAASSASASASSGASSASSQPSLFGKVVGDGASGDSADGSTSGSAAAAAAALTASSTAIAPPAKVSFCRLDIDIYRNTPQVLEHTQTPNTEGWVGTAISVVISGAWSSYRSKITQYFQQLAIITPYAQFTVHFARLPGNVSLKDYNNLSVFRSGGLLAGGGPEAYYGDRGVPKGDFSHVWRRRSTQVPRPPLEVKHHPSAVNDLLLQQLMDVTAAAKGGSSSSSGSSSSTSLGSFLTSQFQCIDRAKANAIADAAGLSWDTPLSALKAKEVHALRVGMEKQSYPPPSGWCLSPAGEYNLRLGIMKELRPDLVATASSSVGVFQGHPFLVEAGVALGGKGTEGLTVHRFANRIPLLFEGGADVATQTALKRIAWNTYKIDPNRDKLGVFVSLVSTKIPFKGTGKEYIGDDIPELRDAVRSALQACCNQLKQKLQRAAEAREKAGRKKALLKYVPDVTRALLANLKAVAAAKEARGRAAAAADDEDDDDDEEHVDVPAEGFNSAAFLDGSGGDGAGSSSGGAARAGAGAAASRAASDLTKAAEMVAQGKATTQTAALAIIRARRTRALLLSDYSSGRINEAVLSQKLTEAVEKADIEAALEQAAASAGGVLGGGSPDGSGGGPRSLFIAPLFQAKLQAMPLLFHPACVLKLLPEAVVQHQRGTFLLPPAGAGGGAPSRSKTASSSSAAAVPASLLDSSRVTATAATTSSRPRTQAKPATLANPQAEDKDKDESDGEGEAPNNNNPNASLFSQEDIDDILKDF